MNILIIATNRHRCPSPVMPFGGCLVAEAAEQEGHKVRLLDLMFVPDPLRAIEAELNKANPDIVGLSIRNIDNNDIENPLAFFRDLGPIMNTIRSATQAPVILGGSALGVMPEELLRYTGADWAVLGDGEVVFPRLLAALSQGEIPNNVPGIARIKDNIFRKNTGYIARFLDGCEVPDFRRWLNVNAYLSTLSTVPIQTKLGCHFKCIYCTYRKIEGCDYRLCAPESVVDAVKHLATAGLKDIEFVDNVFNYPYEHALAICEGLARVRLDVRLQSLELNPRFIDDHLITAIERAGFVGIGITVESASDTVLSELKKGFTVSDIHNAARVIQRHNLPCLWIFMLGGPGETEATVQETFDFVEHFIRQKDTVFFNAGIRIYPGTELEHVARKEGVLNVSPAEMLEPVFYISPAINLDWLINKMHNVLTMHMNYIHHSTVGLSFLPAINRFGYRFGIRPPLWRYTSLFRRGLRFFGINA